MESNNPILVRRACKEASEREEYGVQHAGTVAEVGKMKKSFLGGLDIDKAPLKRIESSIHPLAEQVWVWKNWLARRKSTEKLV